jgi:hypothetical protein
VPVSPKAHAVGKSNTHNPGAPPSSTPFPARAKPRAEKTVATAPAVDTVAREKKRMEKLLHEERFHFLDARIVKTMSVYKRFEHGYLVDKVMALSGKHSERHQPGFSYFFTKEMVDDLVLIIIVL